MSFGEPTFEVGSSKTDKVEHKKGAEGRQEAVSEAAEMLHKMEGEGLVLDSRYGRIVLNIDDRLKAGFSAALAEHDGIVDYNPPYSFAVTLKDKTLIDFVLPQGNLVGEKTWVYDGKQPLKVSLAEIVRALDISLEQRNDGHITLRSYHLEDLHPPYKLLRPKNTGYYVAVEYFDPAIKGVKELSHPKEILSSKRMVEASLYAADAFIRNGSLESLKIYYDSWKEIKSPHDMTFHEVRERWIPARDGWGREKETYVFPDFYEYLAFEDERSVEEIKNTLRERSFQYWLSKQKQRFGSDYERFVWVDNLRVDGENNKIWIARKIIEKDGWVDHGEDTHEALAFSDFEKLCREYLQL